MALWRLMDTREYIQHRIGVLVQSVAMARRSKEDNSQNKDAWDTRITSMETALTELRFILYFMDTAEVHPDLHPEWEPITHEKKFVKKVPRTRSGPQTPRRV